MSILVIYVIVVEGTVHTCEAPDVAAVLVRLWRVLQVETERTDLFEVRLASHEVV